MLSAPSASPADRAGPADRRAGSGSSPLPARAGVVLLAAITVAAVGGLLAAVGIDAAQWFDLDAERRGAAALSALLLLLAGVSTVVVWSVDHTGRAVLPVGVLLCWMAYDEVAFVHERLEAATGVDWQVLYLPAFLAAGSCFLLVLRGYWSLAAFRIAWLAGAACWFVSQVLEVLQWDGAVQRPGYPAMMVTEELLEMVGSASFLMAMVVIATSIRARTADGRA